MIKRNEKLPIKKALFYIVLVTCLVSGTAGLGIKYYFYLKEQRAQDSAYNVVAIIQTSTHKETLRTVYLAELLGLSLDKPKNLYQINLKQEKQKLLASPLIKWVNIEKIRPGTLTIQYTPRIPVAFLGDFTNTAIDEEGFFIPFKPFFSPKKLPEVYLGNGEEEMEWGKAIGGKRGELAMRLFNFFSGLCREEGLILKILDVSQSEDPSLGRRQIVVQLEDTQDSWILRCTPDSFEKEAARYIALRNHLKTCDDCQTKYTRIVDLRVPQLAFLKKEEKHIKNSDGG